MVETITDTKRNTLIAEGSASVVVITQWIREGRESRVYLTRAEIAALAAKFPVEGN